MALLYGAWFYYNNPDTGEAIDPPIQATEAIPIIYEDDSECGYTVRHQYSTEYVYSFSYVEVYCANGFSYNTAQFTLPVRNGNVIFSSYNFDLIYGEPQMSCSTDTFTNISGEYVIDMNLLKPPATDALWVWSVELNVVSYNPTLINKNFGYPDRFLLGRVALSYFDYITYDEPLSYLKTFWGVYEMLSTADLKDPGQGLNVSFQTVRYRGNKLYLKLNPSVIATAKIRCCVVLENLNGWL